MLLRTSTLATAAAAAALTLPAAASAAWTAPEPVLDPGDLYGLNAMAAGDGTLHLAFERDDELNVASRVPGQAWTVDDDHENDPRELVAADDGTLVSVDVDGTTISMTERAPDGTWRDTEVVSDTANSGTAYAVDVSPNGTVAIVWNDSGASVAAVRPRGGEFTEPMQVDDQPRGGYRIGVSNAGEVVVTFGANNAVMTSVRPPDGEFDDEPSELGGTGLVQLEDLAMNARGDVQMSITSSPEGEAHYGAAHRPRGGEFTVTEGLQPMTDGGDLDAAIAPNGDGMIAVHDGDRAYANVRRGSQYDAQTVDLGPAYTGATAAFDAENRAHVAWVQRDPATQDTEVVAVRRGADAAAFGPVERLGGAEQRWLGDLQLLPDGTGAVHAAWFSEGATSDDVGIRLSTWTPDAADDDDDRGGDDHGDDAWSSEPVSVPATSVDPGPVPAPAPPIASRTVPAPVSLDALTARRRGSTARVAFSLTAPVPVTLRVERAAGGRRSGGACLKPTRSTRAGKPCVRWVRTAVGSTVAGRAGANAATLTLRGLQPGRYRVVASTAGKRAAKALTIPQG